MLILMLGFKGTCQVYERVGKCLQVLDSEDQLCHHLFTVHKTESCHCHCHYPYKDIVIAASNIPTAQVAGALKCIARVANY